MENAIGQLRRQDLPFPVTSGHGPDTVGPAAYSLDGAMKVCSKFRSGGGG